MPQKSNVHFLFNIVLPSNYFIINYYNILIVKKDILYLQQNRHDLFKLKPIFE